MAATVAIVISSQQMQQLLASPRGPVYAEILRRGNRVLRQARRLVPVDQGTLKSSLTMEMRQNKGVPIAVVGSSLKYALYVHEGTGLYSKRSRGYIRPVRASVLRWPNKGGGGGARRYVGGRTKSYTFSMRSKGFPGRPFLTAALPAATS